MEIKKPVLTKEQAECLDYWGRWDRIKDEMVLQHLSKKWGSKEDKCLNDLSNKDFITAVYYGYEVEKTPEEAAKQYYDCLSNGQRFSVTKTLNILGIEVGGINKDVGE
ncbi:hypothetical protein [Salicibibacter kimchii]|uniref:DUF1642 domain-containing protein n=1 Tax=Salicibibacter kimchii TaxID=2099786 RepID=A0A345BUG8_9BACI|nr:hypothetical protein [Salicibibacter kimchii]AXF54599.1 hypothetical protein DT065_00255 [Salicibibacter kimchii]